MWSGEKTYLWQLPDWPRWRYDLAALSAPLAEVSRAQGMLLGRLTDLGLGLRSQANLKALTQDVVKTSEIEGEQLDEGAVRSSLARRLGVEIGALVPADRHVDGVVEMVLDATTSYDQELTLKRLSGWHAALFPTGYSGMDRIRVGTLRDDAQGPMEVVSGPVGRRRVHFEAPPAARLPEEMDRFLAWANAAPADHPILKAGLAHLWFVTIHPFEDGNGRIARAVGDLFLARADGCAQRFYSLSAQIRRERADYYAILERTQRGPLDVTPWLTWFLGALLRAFQSAEETLTGVLTTARFWQRAAGLALNPRQAKVLNLLLDGFEGKLTAAKWAKLTHSSPDTALRDINPLVAAGLLRRSEAGGRSTSYELVQ